MYICGKNLRDNKCIIYLMDDNGRPKYCIIRDYKLEYKFGIYEHKNKKDKFILNCF